MNVRPGKKLLIISLALLTLLSILGLGCRREMEQISTASSSNRFLALLVPDTELYLYVYARQERPTIIPAEMANMPYDIAVESLAVWGLPGEEDLVFGTGLTFTSADAASEVYSMIALREDDWKTLQGDKIYIVRGSGTAVESLKTAILNNDFKYYDDATVLEAVTILPRGGRTKLVAIVVAKPDQQLINFTMTNVVMRDLERYIRILKLSNANVIIGGLYSPHRINIGKAADVLETGNGISALDIGVLVLIKSGLPGFVLEPVVKNLLTDRGFIETRLGEFTVYKGFWNAPNGSSVPALIRIDSSYIFAAMSGKEAYAETLITSLYK